MCAAVRLKKKISIPGKYLTLTTAVQRETRVTIAQVITAPGQARTFAVTRSAAERASEREYRVYNSGRYTVRIIFFFFLLAAHTLRSHDQRVYICIYNTLLLALYTCRP